MLASVKCLTLRKQDLLPESDWHENVQVFYPGSKSDSAASASVIGDSKRQVVAAHSGQWTLSNKRAAPVRDRLKELEDMMLLYPCLAVYAAHSGSVAMLLSNFAVAWLQFLPPPPDAQLGAAFHLATVLLDRSLGPKLAQHATAAVAKAPAATGVADAPSMALEFRHGAQTLLPGPCSAVLTERFFAVAFSDRSELQVVIFTSSHQQSLIQPPDDGRKLAAAPNLRIEQVKLPKASGDRLLERKLHCVRSPLGRMSESLSGVASGDSSQAVVATHLLLVWWAPKQHSKAMPWSPRACDQPNAFLLEVSPAAARHCVQPLAAFSTDFDLVGMQLSELALLSRQPSQIWLDVFSVEESYASNRQVHCHLAHYRPATSGDACRMARSSHVTLAVSASVCCWTRSADETRLVLGCEDRTLVIYDERFQSSRLVQLAFLPLYICWPNNAQMPDMRHLAQLVTDEYQLFVYGLSTEGSLATIDYKAGGGVIGCFDSALNQLALSADASTLVSWRSGDKGETLLRFNEFLRRTHSGIDFMIWLPTPAGDKDSCGPVGRLLLKLARGPLLGVATRCQGLFRGTLKDCALYSPVDLTTHYLARGRLTEALALLLTLDWNRAADVTYHSLTLVCNHLLSSGSFSADVQLSVELALSHFYTPRAARPIDDAVVLRYRDKILPYARRFCQTLLRRRSFEKAYLLAVDIGAADLFVDLYHEAVEAGETGLAAACRLNAQQLVRLQRRLRTSSSCSSSSDELSDSDCRGDVAPQPLHVAATSTPRIASLYAVAQQPLVRAAPATPTATPATPGAANAPVRVIQLGHV